MVVHIAVETELMEVLMFSINLCYDLQPACEEVNRTPHKYTIAVGFIDIILSFLRIRILGRSRIREITLVVTNIRVNLCVIILHTTLLSVEKFVATRSTSCQFLKEVVEVLD